MGEGTACLTYEGVKVVAPQRLDTQPFNEEKEDPMSTGTKRRNKLRNPRPLTLAKNVAKVTPKRVKRQVGRA